MNRSIAVLPFLLVALANPLRAEENPPRAEEPTEVWKVIHVNGQRIGYGRFASRTLERNGRPVVVAEDRTQITMKRFGQTIVMQVDVLTTETEQGALLELRTTTRNPPAAESRSHAVVKGNTLELTLVTNGRTAERSLPWKPGTKSPTWDATRDERPLKPGDERTFESFLPDFNKVAAVTTRAIDYETVELLDGEKRRLLKLVSTNSLLPGTTTTYIDDTGHDLLSKVDLLGTEMVLHTVPRKVALEKIEGAELDFAVAAMIPVRRIPDAHRTRRIVYRIHADGDDPSRLFSNGGTQSVVRIDDETIELTVRAAEFAAPVDRQADDEYLAASRFLQLNDERVAAHAARAAGDATDPEAVARALESYVQREIKEKNFSTAMASAAEVAERMEGDCTEHAVLLAAMLRARRIPSRIAVGYVYAESRSAFAGHMWTEAFVGGHWVPLDGTLGRGGTAAAHLKQDDSSFTDDTGHPLTTFLPVLQSLGKLTIEVGEVE